jgi:peptidoglycan/xylan/chitin deacetylase (PgdA/CDA1 family)
VVKEIAGSKSELEARFGLNIYAMAYPNGDYSDREIEIVRSAGYQCALTLDGGFNETNTDLLRLQRIPIYDQADLNELIVKASGLWDLLIRVFGGHDYGHKPTMSADSL